MRINSKLPKTFSIYIAKNGKSGYLRFISSQGADFNVDYTATYVKNIKDASKFVNFDNVKKKALEYTERYNFDEVKVIDDKLMKIYYIKKLQDR